MHHEARRVLNAGLPPCDSHRLHSELKRKVRLSSEQIQSDHSEAAGVGASQIHVVRLPAGGPVVRLPQDTGGVDVAVLHGICGVVDSEPPEGERDGVVWALGVLLTAVTLDVLAVDVGDRRSFEVWGHTAGVQNLCVCV